MTQSAHRSIITMTALRISLRFLMPRPLRALNDNERPAGPWLPDPPQTVA